MNNNYNSLSLISKITFNPETTNNLKETIKKTTEEIYTIIGNEEVDSNKLIKNITNLIDIFKNIPTNELNTLESKDKLYLTYAIRDVLDDVELKMQHIVNLKLIDPANPPNLKGFASHALTESFSYFSSKIFSNPSATPRSILQDTHLFQVWIEESKITDDLFQQSIAEKRVIEKSASKKSEQLSTKFEGFLNSFGQSKRKTKEELLIESTKQEEAEIKETNDSMNEMHKEKQLRLQKVKTESFSIQDAWSEVGSLFYDSFIDPVKNSLISTLFGSYTPDKIFGNKTFKQLGLEDVFKIVDKAIEKAESQVVISKQLKAYIKDMKDFLKLIGPPMVADIRKKIIDNMDLICEGRNLLRLSIRMNNQTQKLVSALNSINAKGELDKEQSAELFLKTLDLKDSKGKPLTDYKKYKTIMRKNISKNMARLVIAEERETKQGVFKEIFNSFKQAEYSLGQSMISKVLVKSCLSDTFMSEFLKVIPTIESTNRLINFFSLEKEVAKLNQFSEIIVLNLFNTMIEEMSDIAVEARRLKYEGKKADVSGFKTDKEAFSTFKKSVKDVASELKTMKTSQQTLFDKCLFGTLSSTASLFDQQGENGAFDLATPFHEQFLSPWKAWLIA
jgi:hypothetical protein